MSRRNLINASLHAAYQMGIRQHAYKVEKKLGIDTTAFLESCTDHIQQLSDMAEVAEEIAMTTPDNMERKLYGGFGAWYSDFANNNQRLPDGAEVQEAMIIMVTGTFEDSLNKTQQDSLHRKLKEL